MATRAASPAVRLFPSPRVLEHVEKGIRSASHLVPGRISIKRAPFHLASSSRVSLTATSSASPSNLLGMASQRPQARPSIIAKVSSGDAKTDAKRVLVPVASDTEEMEAVIVANVLRRAGAHVVIASVEPHKEIVASRKVKLVADVLLSSLDPSSEPPFDLIVLPGGMPGSERLRDCTQLQSLVVSQAEEGRPVAAICAAPAVALQPWGLLNHKIATVHPAFAKQLESSLPPGAPSPPPRLAVDGLITTSQGPGTAFEFALSLVETLYGPQKAADVAGPMVMPSEDGTDSWRIEVPAVSIGAAKAATILVPIAHGTEEMEAVVVVDVLRRAGADVTVASVEDGLEVEAARKVRLVADVLLAEVQGREFDLVVLPGGMPGAERLRDSSALHDVLTRQLQKGGDLTVAAICAAPVVVLQAKGMLQGKRATAHPAFSGQLPDQSAVSARVVRDGPIVTSRGPGTVMEFSLALVGYLFGREKAVAVAGPMVVSEKVMASL